MDSPELSLVIPFLNEVDNIAPMHERIVAALTPLQRSFEILLVDDGSSDGSLVVAERLAATDPRVRVIVLRRNYGQTPATVAGVDHARGKVIVTLDADLQNDPHDIPHLLARLDEGYDVVVGWRRERQESAITRVIPSVVANGILSRISGVPIHDNGCSLRAYRAALLRNLPIYGDMHRFLPAILAAAGARIVEIPVRHHARTAGQSKYGLARIYKVALDLVVLDAVIAHGHRIAAWFVVLGLPFAAGGIAAFAYALLEWRHEHVVFPIPLVGTGLLLVSASLTLLSLGLTADLARRLGQVREDRLASMTGRRFTPATDRRRSPRPA